MAKKGHRKAKTKKPVVRKRKRPTESLPEPPEKPPIEREIESLCRDLDGMMTTLPFTIVAVDALRSGVVSDYNAFLEKHGTLVKSLGNVETYSISPMDHDRLGAHCRQLQGVEITRKVLPRTFVMALVSAYDCFLSRLLACLFDLKPELLNPSEHVLTYAQLKEFETTEVATAFLIEKEIESVLRESHTKQFKWMENRFNVPLTKDLNVWPQFIEVTERRNSFAHCDGKISNQYLKVCRANRVTFHKEPQVGQQLGVSQKYFEEAYSSILEVGVKLAQVLWRKVRPTDLIDADRSLLVTSYELIVREQYELAQALLEFGENTLKKYANEESHRKIVVNLAQTYKWLDRSEDCAALLARYDWTAAKPIFALAVAVLEDRFDGAAAVMRRIGPNGEIPEAEYKLWPLFKEFRKSEQFLSAYAEIFGHTFEVTAEEAKRVSELADKDDASLPN
jgi:hypothetical protein